MNMFIKTLCVSLFVCSSLAQQNQGGSNNRIILTDRNGMLDDRISRPCPVYDLDCIRLFISERSNCKMTYGPTPDPIFKDRLSLYFPSFNLSVTQTAIFFSGFSGITIDDFFVDKEREEVVLQIRARNITYVSNKDFYSYQRNGKEPAMTTSNSFFILPSFSTTTIIRGIGGLDHLDLANSQTTSYIDILPIPFLNPSAGVHPDPIVPVIFASILTDLPLFVQEAFLLGANFGTGAFIQYNICDYRLAYIT